MYFIVIQYTITLTDPPFWFAKCYALTDPSV